MITDILKRNKPSMENLLKVLHEIQEEDPGQHVSHEAIQEVALWLRVPVSSVYGVLRYYSMYSTEPRGRHIIRICNSVVCMMRGGQDLREFMEEKASRESADDHHDVPLFYVELTECLGHCEMSPVYMIDQQVFSGADKAFVETSLDLYRKGGAK